MLRPAILAALLLCSAAAPAAEPEMPRQRVGKYEVSLRLPADGLFAQEEMQIEFRVVDATQVDPLLGATPVVRAQIQAAVDMPLMPGMPKYEELAHPEGVPGEYGVHPTFAHGGEYRLRLAIAPPADQAFGVEFPLAVLDANDARKRRPQPQPFQLELRASPKSPKAGEPVELRLLIHHREKPKEACSRFEVVHEKVLHLIIVRSDLAQFGHEHPDMSPDGVFLLRYTFPAAGDYHLFADCAPKGAGSQILRAKIKVRGSAGPSFDVTSAPAADRSRVKKAGDVQVELKAPAALPARKTTDLAFSLSDAATGQALIDLEPYLGAMGHLILIHQDGVTFVHSHPDERVPNVGRDGTVPFLVRFPKPGLYRGWSQFQRRGSVLTADFIVQAVEAPAEAGQGR